MQSNAAGASLGPRKRLDGMTKLLSRRSFVSPTIGKVCFTYDREGVHADDDDEYHDDVIEFER